MKHIFPDLALVHSRLVLTGACLAGLFAFTGCEREAVPAVEKGKQTLSGSTPGRQKKIRKKPLPVVDALAPTSVIVRVNGEDVVKGEFAAWERMRVKVWSVAKGWKPSTSNSETKKFRLQNRARALAELVKLKLIAQYAKKKGIEPDEKGILAQKKSFLRRIKRSNANFEDIVASFGSPEGDFLRRAVRGDALTMAVLVSSTSNDLYRVSAQELTNRIEFVRQWNARADVTNAAVYARAAKAKAEILAGAYFADVARKYADFAPEQGDKWDTFYLDEFDAENPLGQWLARAETGDISDPLDLEDGISIVGLKLKYVSPISESNKPPVYAYEAVRCPFYAYEKLDDYGEDRKILTADIIENRRTAALKELHGIIAGDAKIEFPSGNNLFYPPNKAKKKSKKKARTSLAPKAASKKALPKNVK